MHPSTGFMGYNRGRPTAPRRDRRGFEDVWRERADLADKVEHLEADLVRFRELEAPLRTTLVSAERAALRAEGAGRARGRPPSSARRAWRRVRSCARRSRESEPLLAEARRIRTRGCGIVARDARGPHARRRRRQARTTARAPGRASAKAASSTYTLVPCACAHPRSAAREPRRRPHGDRRPPRRRLEDPRHRCAGARSGERGGPARPRGRALAAAGLAHPRRGGQGRQDRRADRP